MSPRPSAYAALWQIANTLRRSQAKALVAIVSAIVMAGSMRSFAVAQKLAGGGGIYFKSALQRLYRLFANTRLDDLAVWAGLARILVPVAGRMPVVSLDWTEWGDEHRVLALTLSVGRRALPIFAQAFSKTDMPRSQNVRENTFVQILEHLAPALRGAILLADRGFRRASFVRLLQDLHQRFVVRLAAKIHVSSRAYKGLLCDHPLRPGQQVDLGVCTLEPESEKRRGPLRVRIVGVWQRGQTEPWWLATSERKPAIRIAELYDRRMSVEEAFRDSKGCRFGAQMRWTGFTNCDRISRLFLLAALAMLHWVAAGVFAIRRDPSLRLRSHAKGFRRSLVAIGKQAVFLHQQVLQMHVKRLLSALPAVETRAFAWMEAA